MKLKQLMDEAYKGRVRTGRLGRRKDDFLLGFEDLAERLGRRPTKEDVDLLTPDSEILLAMIRTANVETKREKIIWGYLTSIAAGRSSEPLRLTAKDYAGLELSGGRMILDGEAGPDAHHMGERMRDGRIVVSGRAGDYLGQEMRGGGIVASSCGDYGFRNSEGGFGVILGDSGNYLGVGNRGGRIAVKGSSGDRCGWLMRSGKIRVGGSTGDYLGLLMAGGYISVGGCAGAKAGFQMRGGTVIARDFGSGIGAGKVGGKILRRTPG
jgi:formylmethanofuran dehydrogenase subunit C